jgi:integrase
MKGNIYTRQKCWVCGQKLAHDERRGGCFCPKHPKVAATGQFILKFGRDIRKESKSYTKLARLLNGLRFKTDENTLDVRDYQADNPMAFSKIAEEYLAEKEAQGLKTIGNIRNYVFRAIDAWGDRNIKTIKKRDIKLFLRSLKVSDKTQSNYLSTIRNLFSWCVDEDLLDRNQVPHYPKIEYELGYRNITDWGTQLEIMDELHQLTWDINPKIWIAVELLRTHTNLRPSDLLQLTEADVDVANGILVVWRPTKRKNQRKTVRLTEDEVALVVDMKTKFPALPHVKFFRHNEGRSGVVGGATFGNKYLYKWWKKACSNLGIDDLDLYGGTRHTTTTELAKRYGEDAAKDASEHETNKAFDRYCQMQGERAFEMSKLVKKPKRGEVVTIKKAAKDGADE